MYILVVHRKDVLCTVNSTYEVLVYNIHPLVRVRLLLLLLLLLSSGAAVLCVISNNDALVGKDHDTPPLFKRNKKSRSRWVITTV